MTELYRFINYMYVYYPIETLALSFESLLPLPRSCLGRTHLPILS